MVTEKTKYEDMNRYEKALYNRLPKGLSHLDKVKFMANYGTAFLCLPPATRIRFIRQAIKEGRSLCIVRWKGRLVGLPFSDPVCDSMDILGIEIVGVLHLLKGH